MLPHIVRRGLADFCDVFCEKGYFSVDQSRRILTAARSLGLKLKIHADELALRAARNSPQSSAPFQLTALEHISDEGIRMLRDAGWSPLHSPGFRSS